MNTTKIILVLSSCLLACGAEEGREALGPQCEGTKCDSTDPSDGPTERACGTVDKSGRSESVNVFGLDDDFSRAIGAQTGECDLSVAGLVASLKEAGCGAGDPSEDDVGLGLHSSVFVSERSQRFTIEDGEGFIDYRSITSLKCDQGRVYLHFPLVSEDIKELEVDEEQGSKTKTYLSQTFPAVIAENEDSGVLNYYQAAGDKLIYFGSSLDLLEGTDLSAMSGHLKNGTEEEVVSTFGVERNCAACHPGGGLLMKELDAPWIHWEEDFESPGTAELIDDADGIMGRAVESGPAASLEDTVLQTNRRVNKTRAAHMIDRTQKDASVGIGDLLRPAFCSDEFNIGSGVVEFDFDTSEPIISSPLGLAVVDEEFAFVANNDAINMPEEMFDELLEERDSRIDPSGHFSDRGIHRETLAAPTFMQRARIDEDYLVKLATALEGREPRDEQGELHGDFMRLVSAIRTVDFTRSLYSDERCELAELANQIDVAVLGEVEPGTALIDAFTKLLEGKGELSAPERDLLAALRGDIDGFKLTQEFADQCNERANTDLKAMGRDYLEYVSQVRKRGSSRDAGRDFDDPSFLQFRFPGMFGFAMPVDKRDRVAGRRLSPRDCTLVDQYIPLAE